MHHITKIVAVINDLKMIDTLLTRALTLSKRQDARLEIIYVHEEELFDLPEYFRLKELPQDEPVDQPKVRKEITSRLMALGGDEETPILVFIDDTVDHVMRELEEVTDAMIVMTYHEKTAKALIKKSHLPVLMIKNDITDEYMNIALPVDLSPVSKKSIALAKQLFPTGDIILLHDYRAVYLEEFMDPDGMTTIDLDLELSDLQKAETKSAFEALQHEVGCEGRFLTVRASIQEDIFDFVHDVGNDLIVLGSNNADSLFFESVSFDLMEKLAIDVLVYAPRQ